MSGGFVSGAMPAWGEDIPARDAIRAAIGRAGRMDEAEAVGLLLAETAIDAADEARIRALATRLAAALRGRGARGPVEGLMREYALSSTEGIALMCLAEALLRTPDAATRDALIRDRVSAGDWRAHLGRSPSIFVNAASWGLLVTGRLHATAQEAGLARALGQVLARGGQPLVRRALDIAMRLMGEHFVLGETIEQALERARWMERRGFRYSYDMLGEAAATGADAERYFDAYRHAIAAIGAAASGNDPITRPGISIKLSALHPRYVRSKRARMFDELSPRLAALAGDAMRRGIGLNIDAEEADRLELSLDLFERLCFDHTIEGRDGLGFVVQAYGKRAPAVIDHLATLARRSGRRLMVRLVKGAYWDSEIKHAQEAGLDGFPVFTRRDHTDLCYVACARRMLAAPDAIYPQFATHNARTLATIHTLAGDAEYEFQCLHGMGEPLYEEVVGAAKLGKPCRIYAPVGSHETLLAYLVRRLLENGANTSFVNRIADPSVPIEALAADPRERVLARPDPGAPHEAIRLPRALFGAARPAAAGLDLGAEGDRARIVEAIQRPPPPAAEQGRTIRNPADPDDVVGRVRDTEPADLDVTIDAVGRGAASWAARAPSARADVLRRAGDLLETRMLDIMPLIVREGGRTIPNALGEIREAIDFLRYYAERAETLGAGAVPLGICACISPWNFPLAIFVGQIAAAIAAGNTVVAKPAEETPLVAMAAVDLLYEAGIPANVLRLVCGDGHIGAALVAHPAVACVLFTGSSSVATSIASALARRTASHAHPIPFIAETGGQNAMVVDSSALAEQVVADVLMSAFDSAGQRCSALRVLCLQEEVADRVITMLGGALDELALGDPRCLDTDIGPVINAEARDAIEAHIAAMAARGMKVRRGRMPASPSRGSFVAPALIEIDRLDMLAGEVFGPVLHVLRWSRRELPTLLRDIAATGYALTFGVHTRIEETVSRAIAASPAGNVYVNRNMIGAVVGVQPFGGAGLSGTGPKAGGPLALRRLLAEAGPLQDFPAGMPPPRAMSFIRSATDAGHDADGRLRAMVAGTLLGVTLELPGVVGESNVYRIEPRGAVLCLAATERGAMVQVASVLAAGGEVVVRPGFPCPASCRAFVRETADLDREEVAAALFEGDAAGLGNFAEQVAGRPGAVVPVHALTPAEIEDGAFYRLEFLVRERVVSTNTAAAGGNASLMAIG